MPGRRLHIFLSSTFLDLESERRAAVMAILNARHTPEGMELFAADNRAQYDSICSRIDQCDAYILIVGTRYGTIESASHKSYTELEFNYASSKGMPCMAMVLDDEWRASKAIALGGLAYDNKERADDFRENLLKTRLCSLVKNEHHLSAEIMKALREVELRPEFAEHLAESKQQQELQLEVARLRRELAAAPSPAFVYALRKAAELSESQIVDAQKLITKLNRELSKLRPDKKGSKKVAKSAEASVILNGHTDYVRSCAFSPDSKQIVSGSNDASLIIWDVESGEQVTTLKGHSDCVRTCAYTNDGKRIVSGSNDTSLMVWDSETGRVKDVLKGHASFVLTCAISPKNTQIASGSYDKSVIVWNLNTGTILENLRGHNKAVYSCAYSPDGQRVVAGSENNTLIVWDVKTARQLLTLKGHSSHVTSCAYSPDGAYIVSGSVDSTLIVWDAHTGKALKTLIGHRSYVNCCAYSPDGTRIISGSRDATMILWDAKSGKLLTVLRGHSGAVLGCAFSPDNTKFASSSDDRTVRIWPNP